MTENEKILSNYFNSQFIKRKFNVTKSIEIDSEKKNIKLNKCFKEQELHPHIIATINEMVKNDYIFKTF